MAGWVLGLLGRYFGVNSHEKAALGCRSAGSDPDPK